jgi:hypothetical protein
MVSVLERYSASREPRALSTQAPRPHEALKRAIQESRPLMQPTYTMRKRRLSSITREPCRKVTGRRGERWQPKHD